ncbi:MAG: hypothetical protein ACK4IX_05800 [Candidatus Sericytochromatia bacterium]
MSNLGFELDNEYFANEKFFNPTAQETVKVWVESENDINFWAKIFPQNSSKWAFEIQTTELIADDNKMGTGCDRIKSLVASNSITLGKNSIACIDSDYHRGISWLINHDLQSLQSDPYWFYTILHSIESIFYTPKNIIDTLCSCFRVHSSKLNQDFLSTIDRISSIIYLPMLMSLSNFNFIHKDQKILSSNLNEISRILLKLSKETDPKSYKDLASYHNFVLNNHVWHDIDRDISLFIDSLIIDHVSSYHVQQTIKKMKCFGINENNIYLFFRGHDIDDLIGGIFQKYVSVSKQEKIELMVAKSLRIGECDSVRTQRKQEISNGYLQFKATIKIKSLENLEHAIFFQETFSRLKAIYTD